ncbi:ankyrin repeat domain protein [Nitzschia inconspicua]|uniref:Ankyrin repeat domain protein n=1 Tax=Nitzschia inconspicua TaxID=303405 RepID=A0A9K3PZG8_9STRA|nr:ankyrin repeat domain protein [Nitzschia inconspicua]
MNNQHRPSKRPRTVFGDATSTDAGSQQQQQQQQQQFTATTSATASDQAEGEKSDVILDLYSLIESKQWQEATIRAKEHPDTVSDCSREPSMLALCCREGAPYECTKAVVDAAPHKICELLDARGTPLHEAIVCESTDPRVIAYLLQVDEDLATTGTGPSTTQRRAAISQDVDGYTPLHLVIRRRFQSHVLGTDQASPMLEILELLVQSCAEAIVISDRGEYEEPPIVMALKADVYAPMLQSDAEENTMAQIERHIYNMVERMLQHYPQAASRVFKGYRGHYTALHSAVFHGRSPDTIALLLDAERRAPSSQKACLLGNTQGELPLHFCAMRGEPPRTVRLLAEAAPEAITQRDASGLTPMHWLWIRFVSTLLAMDDGRGNFITLPLRRHRSQEQTDALAFASLRQSDFVADLQLLRRVDPSVDFLRMRHIPVEVQEESDALHWAEKTALLLMGVRDRFQNTTGGDNATETVPLNRLEAVATLFWVKVTSLLGILARDGVEEGSEDGQLAKSKLVKTAFESECCPPLVARLVALLLPEELFRPDASGRVALHYAAMRPWHAWAWPREDGTSDAASLRLLHLESGSLLRNAMSLSPQEAAKQIDCDGRLPLHYMISTCIQACSAGGRSACEDPLLEMVEILGYFVQLNPESLNVRDPRSGLYPFLQASAEATEARLTNTYSGTIHEEFPLSIVYLLLREDPSHIQRGLSC